MVAGKSGIPQEHGRVPTSKRSPSLLSLASTCLLEQLAEKLWFPVEFQLATGKLLGYLLWRIEDSAFKLRLQKSQQFVCLDSDGGAVDTKPADGRIVETFTIVKSTRFAIVLGVRLTAVNGRYLQVLWFLMMSGGSSTGGSGVIKLNTEGESSLRKIADTGDIGLFALATALATYLNRKRPRQNHLCSSSSGNHLHSQYCCLVSLWTSLKQWCCHTNSSSWKRSSITHSF